MDLRRKSRGGLLGVFVASVIVLISWTAAGAVSLPLKINFQGKLLNPTTNAPQNGSFSMVFSLYNVATGGTAIYSETQAAVTVTNGVFSTQLGISGTLSPALFNGTNVYLGINVAGDGEMTPRQQLVTSPYAFTAGQLLSATPIDINPGPAVSTFTTDGSLQLQAGVSGTTGTFSGALVASSGTFTNGVTASELVLNSTSTTGYVLNISSPNGTSMLTESGGGPVTLAAPVGQYTQNLWLELDGVAAPLPAYPPIGAVNVLPSLTVATQQTTGSRPLFFGYPNGSTAWISVMSVGACGAFSQMCVDLGAATLNTALESKGTTLQIGGGDDNNFTDVNFLNSGFVGVANTAPAYTLDVGGATGTQHLVGRSTAPTIARGAGAGTTGTVTVAGTDLAGAVTVATAAGGTAPTANSVIATVTFNAAYATAPYCVFSPANQTASVTLTQAESIYVTATTTTLVLNAGTTALPRPDTYIWNYFCAQ
jgi:hypothetical protein